MQDCYGHYGPKSYIAKNAKTPDNSILQHFSRPTSLSLFIIILHHHPYQTLDPSGIEKSSK